MFDHFIGKAGCFEQYAVSVCPLLKNLDNFIQSTASTGP